MAVNANMFYTDWEDQQVSVPGLLGDSRVGRIDDAGESELHGLELNATYVITNNLLLTAGFGLLDTEFKDCPFRSILGSFANLEGNEFPTAPRQTASLGLTYSQESGFHGSLLACYRGGQFYDVANIPDNEVKARRWWI